MDVQLTNLQQLFDAIVSKWTKKNNSLKNVSSTLAESTRINKLKN